MTFFSSRRESSVHVLFGELAQHVSTAAEAASRTLGEAPSERRHLAHALESTSADAAAVHRRITNRLATSIMTPFEADALHAMSLAMSTTAEAMERAVLLAVHLNVGTLPNPVMEALSLVERLCELTVSMTWSLSSRPQLANYFEEMRRLEKHAHTHVRDALEIVLSTEGNLTQALRMREVVVRVEAVIDACAGIAAAADLLRVKDI